VASNLQELQKKSSEKFGKTDSPQIHLDCDGTEIDDEDYFQTLEPNTELIAVFRGEQWIDVNILYPIKIFIN
jgi:DNA fragmentation factor alpha subunit